MVMFAVRLVVLATVTLFTVISEPKLTWVTLKAKCVNWPVIVTARFAWPCWPLFGLTSVITGVPAVTMNAFA